MRRRFLIALVLILALLVALALLLPLAHGAAAPWWHHSAVFFAIYGVLSSVALLLGAKVLAKLGLHAPEPAPLAEATASLDPADSAAADSAAKGDGP